MARPPAPEPLELVEAFVNTLDVGSGRDELGDAPAAAAWLADRGLVPEGTVLGADDVQALVTAREALRALLLANAGEPLDPETAALLDGIAARAPLVVRVDPDGSAQLTAQGPGVAAAVGSLLAAMVGGMRDGTWHRLKACADDECRWAFYDHSRNRSGTWCSMAGCGNRAKARAFRRRRGKRSAGGQE